MLVDRRCGSTWDNVPLRYCSAGTKRRFLWKKWASRSMRGPYPEAKRAQFLPFRARGPTTLWAGAPNTYRGFHSQRKARQGGVGFLARKLQPADWLGFLRWWLSGRIVINSARLTCSAEACKAVWTCPSRSLSRRLGCEGTERQPPGGGGPALRLRDRNPKDTENFLFVWEICLVILSIPELS